MTRTGKIARLPREIRDELNRRLADSESGGSLLNWLNDLPAVKEILLREFAGRPISKQNLCKWRAHGFVEWQSRRELLAQARELAASAPKSTEPVGEKWTDHIATLLAVRYATALAGWDGEVTGDFRRQLRVLRGLCQEIVQLRRGDLTGARLKLEQEWHAFEHRKNLDDIMPHFGPWLKSPAAQDSLCPNPLTPEPPSGQPGSTWVNPGQPSKKL